MSQASAAPTPAANLYQQLNRTDILEMNVALWVIAGVLAALFGLAGLMKTIRPREDLASDMPWVTEFAPGAVKSVGVVDLLGAVGLIVPAAVGVVPVLSSVAAAGLAIEMLLAARLHWRRGETQMIGVSIALFVVLVALAIMRFGPERF